MQITIESTEEITSFDGTMCRVWKGKTEGGIDCLVFVHRIAVSKVNDTAQFDKELKETLPPGSVVDLRNVL